MAAPVTFTKPNLYTLHGGGIHVSYSTSGFDGKPHFTYQDVHGSQSFSDTQINVASTPIGDVVTVTIRRTVDAGSTSFSVLIPTVNLMGPAPSEHIHTDGITTIHRFSIVPAFNQGQTELYQFTPLGPPGRRTRSCSKYSHAFFELLGNQGISRWPEVLAQPMSPSIESEASGC